MLGGGGGVTAYQSVPLSRLNYLFKRLNDGARGV